MVLNGRKRLGQEVGVASEEGARAVSTLTREVVAWGGAARCLPVKSCRDSKLMSQPSLEPTIDSTALSVSPAFYYRAVLQYKLQLTTSSSKRSRTVLVPDLLTFPRRTTTPRQVGQEEAVSDSSLRRGCSRLLPGLLGSMLIRVRTGWTTGSRHSPFEAPGVIRSL